MNNLIVSKSDLVAAIDILHREFTFDVTVTYFNGSDVLIYFPETWFATDKKLDPRKVELALKNSGISCI